ncbi:uncharacterized protein LOC132720947 [Ruditapes philippinarum]|uniref:uncharacterized protein LOC132720947 n=1 Tax=Ruditapes philippinarum TaxID=129788 RepID=UPI00295C3656|nr:uncharacterized protein LOC132720947 [Ruditapes philippinarum]
MSISSICPKSQPTSTQQVSEKLLQDDIRNELKEKKKTKKGFFTNVFRRVLACFATDDKTSQKKRRSKSALPPQGQRKSMPQKHCQVGQRKRRTANRNSSRAEKRNDSAFELKMYLDDHYDYMQHMNRHNAEIPKEPASKRQNTKVSGDVFSLRKPNFKRESRQADDIQCHPAKQQTSDDQVKCTQHGNIGITDDCPKAQATGTRQISKKIVQGNTRNKLTDKKKTKKGFFTDVFCTFLACFGVRNDRK